MVLGVKSLYSDLGSGSNGNDDDGLSLLGGIFGGVALGLAGAYTILRLFSKDGAHEEEVTRAGSTPSLQIRAPAFTPDYHPHCFPTPDSTRRYMITVAVDATPFRAGGLLVLPRQKLMYFYSKAWPSNFKFPVNEPDKFEMANAYLALVAFEEYVSSYKDPDRDSLRLMTDNSFASNPGSRHRNCQELFGKANMKLTNPPFDGEWKIAHRQSDEFMYMADRLSKGDATESSHPPATGNPNCPGTFLPGYQKINISWEVGNAMSKLESDLPLDWVVPGRRSPSHVRTTTSEYFY